MTNYERRALIWQRIEGSERLYEIYKFYPTLHDALITKVDCSFEEREVNATFYYSDMIGEDIDSGASTLITLCWQDVIEANFSFNENDLDHLELEFADEKFETVLSGAYFEGRIISGNIKVSEVIPEPNVSEDTIEEFRNLKFSIK